MEAFFFLLKLDWGRKQGPDGINGGEVVSGGWKFEMVRLLVL